MAKKEKQSKWGIILVLFISFIMVSSIIGFLYSGSENNDFRYNKIKFQRANAGWSASINRQTFFFDYFPAEVENIELSPEAISLLSGKPEIDTTSGINDTFAEDIALAQYNMNLALNNVNVYLRNGFTANSTFNMPIITCSDATYSAPVIYFMQSNETKVSIQNNCIIAEARNNIDILRIKDRIVYSIIGIIR